MATVMAAAAAAACLLAGCKDQVEPSALERFVERTSALDGQVLEDTLRSFLDDGPPNATYASFLLGNRFYDLASDSAAAGGWDTPGTKALLDSAEVHFMRAIGQDSTFVEALVNMGSVWDDRAQMRGSREDRDHALNSAIAMYMQAVAVDSTGEKARCNLGGVYMRQRRLPEAIEQFQAVLDHDPKSALAHYNLAIMFAEQKIYREALKEWELAAKYDPDGDIGSRSRENVKIVMDLMNAPAPQGAAH